MPTISAPYVVYPGYPALQGITANATWDGGDGPIGTVTITADGNAAGATIQAFPDMSALPVGAGSVEAPVWHWNLSSSSTLDVPIQAFGVINNPNGVYDSGEYLGVGYPFPQVASSGSGSVSVLSLYATITYFEITLTSTFGGTPTNTPAHGPLAGGTPFNIVGTGFSDHGGSEAVYVTVGGTPATDIVLVSDTLITCVSPSIGVAGNQNVYVNYAGAEKTLAGGFLYDATPEPTWKFNSLTNHLKQSLDEPELPWREVEDPDPTLNATSGITPVKGPTRGGTVIG